jgi:hypothetical protein
MFDWEKLTARAQLWALLAKAKKKDIKRKRKKEDHCSTVKSVSRALIDAKPQSAGFRLVIQLGNFLLIWFWPSFTEGIRTLLQWEQVRMEITPSNGKKKILLIVQRLNVAAVDSSGKFLTGNYWFYWICLWAGTLFTNIFLCFIFTNRFLCVCVF